MKMIPLKMMMVAGIGLAGYLFVRNNPNRVSKMKKIGRDTSRAMYHMFEEEDS